MIFTEDLSKRFDNFLAVDGISLNVDPGQVLVLLGPNGAGKTTTIRMLSSILRPSSGRARVAGYDVVKDAGQVRARVGVLAEQQGLYGRMRAGEYLEFFGRLYGLDRAAVRQHADRLLEEFGLAEAQGLHLGQYSRGMRQKLALIRALLHDPPVLLLDEPTSAMDPESAHAVRDAIQRQRAAGRTVILCTHNLHEAEELADQVAIIRRGRIIYRGALAELMRNLLGPTQYLATYSGELGSWTADLPEGVVLASQGPGWLRFQVDDPRRCNPLLLHQMLDQQVQVITFQEAPRNLEQAYLEAIGRDPGGEAG